MLGRILIVGALVLVVMLAVRNGWVLRRTGLTGSCTVYARIPDGPQQEKCTSGAIGGRPNLTGKGCSSKGLVGMYEVWLCPAPLVTQPAGA